MRHLFYLTIISVVILVGSLTGCSDEKMEPVQSNAVKNPESTLLEMALQRAEDFFVQIGANTRSPRQVENVRTLCGKNTRSGIADTLLFLVNYTDNHGFALLGADPAINDIYAISPEGSLTYEDIANNPVLSDFFYDVVTYALNPPGYDTINVDGWRYWRYRNIERNGPLLSSTASNWHQGYPFNMYTFAKPGLRSNPGCTAVSLGMWLSFYERPSGVKYEWPYSTPKFNFDWDRMVEEPGSLFSDSVVAKMFYFLGSSPLLNVTYDSIGGVASISRFTPALELLGARSSLLFNQVNLSANIDSITNFVLHGRISKKLPYIYNYKAAPLIAFGKHLTNKDKNHAWIIDGVVTRERCMTDAKGSPINPPIGGQVSFQKALPMWHCVWGQKVSGRARYYDGWYVYLKDQQKLDSIQYDPFSANVTPEGLCPVKPSMYTILNKWEIWGGCFPDTAKLTIIL